MNNIPETDETYEFPEGILKDGSNHLVILQVSALLFTFLVAGKAERC
jgi:hypothetical protein